MSETDSRCEDCGAQGLGVFVNLDSAVARRLALCEACFRARRESSQALWGWKLYAKAAQ